MSKNQNPRITVDRSIFNRLARLIPDRDLRREFIEDAITAALDEAELRGSVDI